MPVLPVLLGGDANVYGMARSFWDCYRIRSAVLCCRALPALWGSRLLSCVVQEPTLRTEAGFVRALVAFAKRTPHCLRILVPCDDAYTWLLARHESELAGQYRFRVPSLAALEALAIKQNFAAACRTAGLRTPETLTLGELPESLPFAPPYALKPADPDTWNATAFPGQRKVYFLETAAQLREALAYIRGYYQDTLLLQSYIKGPDTRLSVLNFYCPASGMPWAVQGTPLLQEPTSGGIGNYAAVLIEPARQDAALIAALGNLLQAYGWKGFANIDLKYVPDGTPVLFELNPRQGRASYACCAAGAQLVHPPWCRNSWIVRSRSRACTRWYGIQRPGCWFVGFALMQPLCTEQMRCTGAGAAVSICWPRKRGHRGDSGFSRANCAIRGGGFMCGIAGFVDRGHSPAEARRTVQAMTARLAHRGPDGGGLYADGCAALGHRRLAIIDPAGGAQPIFNEDGTLAVVFNGEIYNYPALARQLQALGHRFATAADTEVLLHGYEEWGIALPTHLRGMFAFALWDARTRRLFCARDDFGIKPLYYYQKDEALLFASEIKALEPHPLFTKRLELSRLPDLLSIEYLPGPETFFAGVRELLPGQTLTWQAGRISLSEPHQPRFVPESGVSLANWACRIDAAVADSVQAHSLADTEVGCFLSGGVDSAYITAHAAQVIPRLRCFSVGYAEQDCSELADARRTAAVLGVPLQETLVTAQDFFAAIPAVQAALEEPMANPAAVPLYYLCCDAARKVKVVLAGEGADELFGGYPLYRQGVHNQAWGRLPLWLRRVLAKGFPQSGFLHRGALLDWQRCARANYVFADWQKRNALLTVAGTNPARCFRPYFAAAMARDEATALQWVDQQTWLPFDILRKADRMSMAHGLELRVPFLDPVVRAQALALPRKYRVCRTADKIVLRTAAGRMLPLELTRRRKRGFPVPLAAWLRQDRYYELVRDTFTDITTEQFFDRTALLALLDAHRSGKVGAMGPIFSLYSFLVWYTEVFQK